MPSKKQERRNSIWPYKINDIIGKKEIDKIDDRDDRLVIKAIITQIKQTKKPMEKFIPINPPSIVAMPLPPLNFNQIGKQWPIIEPERRINKYVALSLVNSKYLNKIIKNRLLKASSNSTNKAKILLPVLNALVAPIFPLPIFLISPYPHKLVKIKPNGMDPKK